MSERGESKAQKSISAPKARFLKRRLSVWTIRTKAGPHSGKASIPLGFIVRDMLGATNSMFETKKVLNAEQVLVNGTARNTPQFAVGLFDVVELVPANKKYRVVLDTNSRLVLSELKPKSASEKVSKVLGKHAVKKGVIQLTTMEGFVFMEKKTGIVPGDSIKISLPAKKILSQFELKKGNLVYFTSGKKVSLTGKITGITEGTRSRPKLVNVDVDGTQVQTVEKNVVVIGNDKAEMDMGEPLEVSK